MLQEYFSISFVPTKETLAKKMGPWEGIPLGTPSGHMFTGHCHAAGYGRYSR